MTRTLHFSGVGAFVGRVDGPHQFAVWASRPDKPEFEYKPSSLICINADLCPGGALDPASGVSWDKVVIDDGPEADGSGNNIGGLTTLVPFFKPIGMVYFTKAHLDNLIAAKHPIELPTQHFPNTKPYEFESVLDIADDGTKTRYLGFHAIVADGKVRVYHRGKSTDNANLVDAKVTLVDLLASCRADFTTFKPGDTSGAIFLERRIARMLGLKEHKAPYLTGDGGSV